MSINIDNIVVGPFVEAAEVMHASDSLLATDVVEVAVLPGLYPGEIPEGMRHPCEMTDYEVARLKTALRQRSYPLRLCLTPSHVRRALDEDFESLENQLGPIYTCSPSVTIVPPYDQGSGLELLSVDELYRVADYFDRHCKTVWALTGASTAEALERRSGEGGSPPNLRFTVIMDPAELKYYGWVFELYHVGVAPKHETEAATWVESFSSDFRFKNLDIDMSGWALANPSMIDKRKATTYGSAVFSMELVNSLLRAYPHMSDLHLLGVQGDDQFTAVRKICRVPTARGEW